MDTNYLSDDEEYTNYIDEQDNYGNIKIEYDRDYVGYDSNDEINEDELDEEELKEYLEYQEYKKRERELIMNSSKRNSEETLYCEEKIFNDKKKKPKEPKKNNSMNFAEFNNYIDKVIEDKKPKKFISKRLLEKKGLNEDTYIVQKQQINKSISNSRKFNPKLPPYFHVHKKNINL
jgi:hypothetical protein